MQAIKTVRHIVSNPGISLIRGLARYVGWQIRRRKLSFPFRVDLTEGSHLLIERPSDVNGCVCLAQFEGAYDFNNMNFLRLVLETWPEQVVFDIGANIGVYSLICSEETTSRVIAFEPHPATADQLERNLASNDRKNVKVIRKALSDQVGELSFTDDEGSPVNRLMNDGEQGQATIRVSVSTGAMVCEEEDLVPSVIKLDVEGHEVEVLRGLGDLLSGIQLLVIEENAGEGEVDALLPESLMGPYYVDYQARRISKTKLRKEDAVYLHRDFAEELGAKGWTLLL